MTRIDLRSDTLTMPTEAMRRAMAAAELGDDVYGEDPTVRRLEERAAEALGKESALYTPTGTMANQIALLVHCRPGDEVIVGEGAHVFFYEGGAGGAFAGVQFLEAGSGGLFTADELEGCIKPDYYFLARTRLVAIENTHNRAGGRVFPQSDVEAIAQRAKARGMSVHLDGARIWNASVASDATPAALAAPADTVSACFSKGLGAPVGSVIAGSREHVDLARRYRRMLGGGMRQAGVIAAGALYALEHHVERLAEDHEHARVLARGLAGADGLRCDVAAVETNIVAFEVETGTADAFVARAESAGVLLHALGPKRIRAVTHLGIERDDIARAVTILSRVATA